MTFRRTCLALAICATLLGFAPIAAADQETDQARKIYKTHADSILWIEAVLKVQFSAGSMPTRTQEEKQTLLGTVIDESGLMVCSLSQLDPASLVDGQERNIRGERMKISASSEFIEVKVRMPDKTEVPAKVVMKDTSWDLAFLMIDKSSDEFQGQSLSAVKLDPKVEATELDKLVVIQRLGKAMKYTPAVDTTHVAAVVTKPRTLYVAGSRVLGTPVFKLDGKALGISIVWVNRQEGSGGPVILPAADVLEIAKQAEAAAAKMVEAENKAVEEIVEEATDEIVDDATEEIVEPAE
ncbi:MAG: hypothetical protein ACLFUJ_08735 [Phycisphaerae bacterium]